MASEALGWMRGEEWLDEVARRTMVRLEDVAISRPDPDTLGLSRLLRTIIIYVDDDQAWLAPSFAVGGTLGNRLQNRVQHLDIQEYRVSEATVDVAVSAAFVHLRG